MPHNTFPDSTREALKAIGRRCRTVAALLISGLWPRRGFPEVEAQLETLPAHEQALIVGGTLVLLVAGAFFAAQVGILGLLAYLLVVIVVAR
jgi:hypothetical protein